MRTTDSNYRLDQAGEHFTRSGILLWRDSFYPKEAKWAHGHGRLSRANTHIMCSSNSYGYGDNGESLSLHSIFVCFNAPNCDKVSMPQSFIGKKVNRAKNFPARQIFFKGTLRWVCSHQKYRLCIQESSPCPQKLTKVAGSRPLYHWHCL